MQSVSSTLSTLERAFNKMSDNIARLLSQSVVKVMKRRWGHQEGPGITVEGVLVSLEMTEITVCAQLFQLSTFAPKTAAH